MRHAQESGRMDGTIDHLAPAQTPGIHRRGTAQQNENNRIFSCCISRKGNKRKGFRQ